MRTRLKLSIVIILISLLFGVGCGHEKKVNIIERLEKEWSLKLPNEMHELYNCYQPTFTGRAFQYAVMNCSENSLEELMLMYEFKKKDSSSDESLESFFRIMNNDEKDKINDEYILDLSKDYEYYVVDNSVWFIVDTKLKEVCICIFGY